MNARDCDCSNLDGVGTCTPLPQAFVRLRYFFGKRMGVPDFVDEQLYHASKMRFHNEHLHGAGVVCGLRISAFGATGIRVGRGAALDACGREIVVGIDQCVDVAAWIARERTARLATDPNTTWPKSDIVADHLALAVVLRYRECPSSPEAAPRDPCSCESGGCDFGRVREGFELDLRTDAQAKELAGPTSSPTSAELSAIVAAGVSGSSVRDALVAAVTAPVGSTGEDEWLVLGALDVTFAGDVPTAVSVTSVAPPILLQTAVLQDLLLRTVAANFDASALVDGAPEVRAVAVSSENGAGTVGNTTSAVLLASGKVVTGTLKTNKATLMKLDLTNGWSQVLEVEATGDPMETKSITVALGNLPKAGAGQTDLYRLSLGSDPKGPICDRKLRRLLPAHFAWDFTVDSAGQVMAATLA